jgi:hypothetical protein
MANGPAAGHGRKARHGTGPRRQHCQGQQPDRRLFIGIRKVQRGRALVGSQRRQCQLPTSDVANAGSLGRALRSRGGVRCSDARLRGAARRWVARMAFLRETASLLVTKRPSFSGGHNYRTCRAARRCAAAEQRRRGRCAHGVIARWRRAAAAHAQYGRALP